MAMLSAQLTGIQGLDAWPRTMRRLLGERRNETAGWYDSLAAVRASLAGAAGLLREICLRERGRGLRPELLRDTRYRPDPPVAADAAAFDGELDARAAIAVPPRPAPHGSEADRFETKYCVPPDVAAGVMRLAGAFLDPDANQPTPGFQRITSLYFDTPDLMLLRWTAERRPRRFKLRIRAYGDGEPTAVYAEIKTKECGVGRKRRAPLPGVCLDGEREHGWQWDVPLADDDVRLQEFVWLCLRYCAEPRLLIRTERLALRGSHAGDETAVTIDRCLEFQPSRRLAGEAWAWQRLRMPERTGADGVVLEFKHGVQAPIWMAEVERRLRPWRRSFSKYARAMSQLFQSERL